MSFEYQNLYQKTELFFGLVGAIGCDTGLVYKTLKESLSRANYLSDEIKLSSLLRDIWPNLATSPKDDYYEEHMDAGDKLRKKLKKNHALAQFALGKVREIRKTTNRRNSQSLPSRSRSRQNLANVPINSHAYIFNSLKRPEELNYFRTIYGSLFLAIGAYTPRDLRRENLANWIAASHGQLKLQKFRSKAEYLIDRDESEEKDKYGQDVGKAYSRCDVFVDATNPVNLRNSVDRFIDLIFRSPFHTPTRDEFAMVQARVAALRSADLGRQVGAVISTADGEVVAVGVNEVPKFGGGLYWEDDESDGRDFKLGVSSNEQKRKAIIADTLKLLKEAKWLKREYASIQDEDLANMAISNNGILKGGQIASHISFDRTVHAEMAAITDASRRGVSVAGLTLYTTTFPCHNCAKHIVASGLKRIVYIEPYPKSLAVELHSDSLVVDSPLQTDKRSMFVPFVGISPDKYMEFFSIDFDSHNPRKDADGNVLKWNINENSPRVFEFPFSYLPFEQIQVEELRSINKT